MTIDLRVGQEVTYMRGRIRGKGIIEGITVDFYRASFITHPNTFGSPDGYKISGVGDCLACAEGDSPTYFYILKENFIEKEHQRVPEGTAGQELRMDGLGTSTYTTPVLAKYNQGDYVFCLDEKENIYVGWVWLKQKVPLSSKTCYTVRNLVTGNLTVALESWEDRIENSGWITEIIPDEKTANRMIAAIQNPNALKNSSVLGDLSWLELDKQ